jgi:hypothetical protein
MMSNKTTKTEGKLQASGTSVSGFSSTNVSAQKNTSDKGYTFEGVSTKDEHLVFFVRSSEITQGKSYPIEQYGQDGTAVAVFIDKEKDVYNGESGEIKFERFDAESQIVEIVAKFVMSNGSVEKSVEARGEFKGIEQSNKKVLDEKGAFKVG